MTSPEPDIFPVTSGQRRMWFLSRLEPDLAVSNVNLFLPMPSDCDPDQVHHALGRVMTRHGALRTSFALRDGELVQRVHTSLPVAVSQADLRKLPDADREPEFRRIARQDAAQPFPLDRPPLWRARLVRLTDDETRLVFICHHTVFDRASAGPFVEEFLECYDAACEDRPSKLTDLTVQFTDHAVRQRKHLSPQRATSGLGHWREKLSDLPADLGLPSDRPRPPVRSYRGEAHEFALGTDITARVENWSQRNGVTTAATLLAGFKALLARWSGNTDIFVGCPMAGRALPELESLIGMFMNPVVVRTDLAGEPSFREVAHRVRDSLLESSEHHELPFERIVEKLRPARDLSRSPVYQVTFNLAPSGSWREFANGTVQVDLALDLTLREGRLHGRLEYATDLFDAATVERLAEVYQILLDRGLRDPDLPLSRLPLLTGPQRTANLLLGHGTAMDLPSPAVLSELLRAQAETTPDAVALVCGSEQLSYAEVHARADRLAARLRGLGVGPEVPVAVCVERSPDLVVALLAVLNTGGVLVPLDPEHPSDRLMFQITDSDAAVLLTQQDLSPTLGDPGCPVVLLDGPGGDSGVAESAVPKTVPDPDNAAYLLYTSDPSGWPKGVVTSHRALVNRLEWMQRRFCLTTDDVVLHQTPVSFDVSLWELFWPLVTGARLLLAHPSGHHDPGYLCDEITRQAVTTVHFVPSMLDGFLDTDGVEGCRSLRRVVSSGEELTRSSVRRCHERLPGAELHNLYGPTEAAIDVSAWQCPPGESGPVPIGRPMPNTRLYVLDRWLEPVPVGFPGDLCIGGVQLARGYLGEPARTAEAFLPDPYGPPGDRLYRTGDRARVRPDGAIEFLGRADTQVKVYGVRVELGELESVLAEHSQVRQVVAAVRDDAPGGRGLVAYICWDGDPGEVTTALRELLARRVPKTLIPRVFVVIPEFATLPGGKVDRTALPAPDGGNRSQVKASYQPPDTPTEHELCAIWAELLGRDRIGVADDFFDLGGHSLLAVALVERLRDRFGVHLPLRRCFEITTISEHALEILRLSSVGQSAGPRR